MKKLLLLAAWCACAIGCSKQADLSIQQQNIPERTKSHLISPDSVRRIAAELPARFAGAQTRSVACKPVSSMTPLNRILPKTATKSGDAAQPDYVYVVNYADEGGFALISADTRLDQVLAYSERGDFESALGIPAVEGLITNIPGYAEERLALMVTDSTDGPAGEYYIDQRYSLSTQTDTKGPFITTRWGQWAPFDKYTSGVLYGCTIAMVQLMAYYEWPLSIQNVGSMAITIFDWPVDKAYTFGFMLEMYPESVERIARIAQKIRSELTGIGTEVTNITTTEVVKALPNYKFAFDDHRWYAFATTKSDLDKNRPVIVSGYGSQNGSGQGREENGWIVDGYQQITTSYQNVRVWYSESNNHVIREENLHVSTEVQNLLHCNWGCDGRGDGYFIDGLFAPQRPYSHDFTMLPTTDDHHYQFTVKQCVNVRPQHLPK